MRVRSQDSGVVTIALRGQPNVHIYFTVFESLVSGSFEIEFFIIGQNGQIMRVVQWKEN